MVWRLRVRTSGEQHDVMNTNWGDKGGTTVASCSLARQVTLKWHLEWFFSSPALLRKRDRM